MEPLIITSTGDPANNPHPLTYSQDAADTRAKGMYQSVAALEQTCISALLQFAQNEIHVTRGLFEVYSWAGKRGKINKGKIWRFPMTSVQVDLENPKHMVFDGMPLNHPAFPYLAHTHRVWLDNDCPERMIYLVL